MKKQKKGDDPKKRMRSARVSTSPIRGVKGGGLGLKSTKEFARFRVLACEGRQPLRNGSACHALPFRVDETLQRRQYTSASMPCVCSAVLSVSIGRSTCGR